MLEKRDGLIVCSALRFNEGSKCSIRFLRRPVVKTDGCDLWSLWKKQETFLTKAFINIQGTDSQWFLSVSALCSLSFRAIINAIRRNNYLKTLPENILSV